MKHILDIPYHSQFESIKKDEWKNRACSIVCLKMAIDFLIPAENRVTADNLFEESEQVQKSLLEKELITPKLASNGRVHDVIVFLAHNHGLPAYKEEFKSLNPEFQDKMLEIGIKKMADAIEKGEPVIISVFPGLSAGKSFHTIIMVGTEKEGNDIKGFYYHDPDANNGTLENQFIDLEKFKQYWRRLVIFFD